MATASHVSRTLPRGCQPVTLTRNTCARTPTLQSPFYPGAVGAGAARPTQARGKPLPAPALTAQQNAAEEPLPPLQGVAVPAVPAELVLALGRPGGHAAADGQHRLGVPPAQLPLPAHQARHVVAHHPRRAHGAHVPAGGKGQGSAGGPRRPPGTDSEGSRVLSAPEPSSGGPELQLPLPFWWKSFTISHRPCVFF